MSTPYRFFATTSLGLELLLVEELTQLGAKDAAEKLAGVEFSGDLAQAYKACLWSRLANRILVRLDQVTAATPFELYAGIKTIRWVEHIDPSGTFAVHFVSVQSAITHTLFGAQKVKDAIVDQMREEVGYRPSVDRERPEVNVYIYLRRDLATIYIDLSGTSLHKRGYRLQGGAAPLKENLAAGMLIRAGWPLIAKQGGTLLDPMCGSGTLLIEAAWMAGHIAPGLLRQYFGLIGWRKHEKTVWESLLKEAEAQSQTGLKHMPPIVGYDHDASAIKIAFENIERAGLHGKIHVEKRSLTVFAPKQKETSGLIITNPPYGERLGEEHALQPLYACLGERLKEYFPRWKAAILTGNPALGKQMGLRAQRYYTLFNGGIPCKLLIFAIEPHYFVDRSPEAENERRINAARKVLAGQEGENVSMFINRLRKNLKRLKNRNKPDKQALCRIYDADIPEYAFAIDLSETSAHVYEYQAPKSVDPKKALRRQQEVLAVLPELLNLPPAQIFFNIQQKVRSGNK